MIIQEELKNTNDLTKTGRLKTYSTEDVRLDDFMDDEYMDKVANYTKSIATRGFTKPNSFKNKGRRHSVLSNILSNSYAMNTKLEIAEESNENSIKSKNFSNKF